jgi:RIO kinase 1
VNRNANQQDDYDDFEALFDPMQLDRQARRKRKPKANHQPKKSQDAVLDEITEDLSGLEGGFTTTYQPSRHEELWLLSSLRSFYDQSLITDVLSKVKGGKEASVYRCAGSIVTEAEYVAAKVYRPRMFRNLRNDKMYRQGREVLKSSGKAVKGSDQRMIRAIGKKTAFGEQVSHTSWLMYEYTTLEMLYQAGGAVPKPIAASENAILMSYHGNASMPAPTLSEVELAPEEVEPLFEEVMRNIALMLSFNVVHGDLSPYNILYWEGEITIIDFPQVINTETNENAFEVFERDVQRVCDYFIRLGMDIDPDAVVREYWDSYGAIDPQTIMADFSRNTYVEEE